MNKSSYKVDLRALHAQCEANYARLLRLFPDYESSNKRSFSVGGTQIHMDVLERSRYTTLFLLQSFAQTSATSSWPWLTPLRMEVRAYHDAGMLEVIVFQGSTRTAGRYSYPNPSMHQQDEKAQQNAFLAEWLSNCLTHGEVLLEDFRTPGAERV